MFWTNSKRITHKTILLFADLVGNMNGETVITIPDEGVGLSTSLPDNAVVVLSDGDDAAIDLNTEFVPPSSVAPNDILPSGTPNQVYSFPSASENFDNGNTSSFNAPVPSENDAPPSDASPPPAEKLAKRKAPDSSAKRSRYQKRLTPSLKGLLDGGYLRVGDQLVFPYKHVDYTGLLTADGTMYDFT